MNVKHLAIGLITLFCIVLAVLFALSQLHSGTSALALQRGHYKQAVQHLRNDADGGDVASLTMLANLHHLGLGVPRDPDKSVSLYSEAAFAGDVAARINLGHAYSQGLGVVEDAGLAYAWYNLARNGGSEVAQVYMSILLAEHRLRYNKVIELKMQYATIKNFNKLH